jgi:hypothetical protein
MLSSWNYGCGPVAELCFGLSPKVWTLLVTSVHIDKGTGVRVLRCSESTRKAITHTRPPLSGGMITGGRAGAAGHEKAMTINALCFMFRGKPRKFAQVFSLLTCVREVPLSGYIGRNFRGFTQSLQGSTWICGGTR